ncbi:nucleotidyl transferase AbiEii/AbiGii toxin family protein [Longimicrobium sp.]|uniref:nucleotidyl transferase AbiEii/AbiGii toxin family protein n=1 Tax=Longimicrobium sp. TaxID=2029185 RepID=UPI002E329603|nr:nucleotidyl transferase AbiEii/AbiGii toxin family protein [Longimicrobium sp.]HEX6037289.1 nucleotidyl transferase AbiEii/AbiGii toxin family protein [Longimicrobium sp.]
MTNESPRNVPASVRQRLLNLARERGEDFNFLLTLYGLERLLYRLGRSPHRADFVLKGAMLLRAWSVSAHRPTRDLDLLGRGEPSRRRLESIFASLWETHAEKDGLELEPGTLRSEEIRENQEYGGVRVTMAARLGNARVPMQVDVGFGDAVTPGITEVTYPTLLDGAAPVLLAYPPETVVAEKLQAMVSLGLANTRMKDFYDLWIIARSFDFSGETLCGAISATFTRRETAIPGGTPVALSPEYFDDPARQRQWTAFLARTGLSAPDLASVTEFLRGFLLLPLDVLHADKPAVMTWPAGGPWTR